MKNLNKTVATIFLMAFLTVDLSAGFVSGFKKFFGGKGSPEQSQAKNQQPVDEQYSKTAKYGLDLNKPRYMVNDELQMDNQVVLPRRIHKTYLDFLAYDGGGNPLLSTRQTEAGDIQTIQLTLKDESGNTVPGLTWKFIPFTKGKYFGITHFVIETGPAFYDHIDDYHDWEIDCTRVAPTLSKFAMNIPIAGLFEDEGEKNSDNKYHKYYVPLQFNDVVTRENVELIVDRGNQILEITVDPQYHERVAAKMDIISFKTNGGVLLPRAFHPINFQKHGASINKKYQTWIQQAFPHTQGVAAKQSQSVRPQMQGAPAPSARAPQSQQDVQGQMTGVLNERRLWREEQLRKRNQRIEAEKLAASKPRAEDSQVLDIPEIADIMAIEAEI